MELNIHVHTHGENSTSARNGITAPAEQHGDGGMPNSTEGSAGPETSSEKVDIGGPPAWLAEAIKTPSQTASAQDETGWQDAGGAPAES